MVPFELHGAVAAGTLTLGTGLLVTLVGAIAVRTGAFLVLALVDLQPVIERYTGILWM